MSRIQYKEDISKIKEIARKYNRAMQELIVAGVDINHGYLYDPDGEAEIVYKTLDSGMPNVFNNQRFVLGVNYALSVLPMNYRVLIWSDYFKVNNRDWWYAYYSKSSYYRLRKNAIEAFVAIIK